MNTVTGRRIRLSLPRRLIGDLLHFARQVPTVPVQRRMNLGPLLAARQRSQPRPSWAALFTKAFALVARDRKELRRFYVGFPWGHLYEPSLSIATIAVERTMPDGEDAVFFIQFAAPEVKPLAELDRRLRKAKEAPLSSIGSFRRALLVGRLPGPLRRLLWWIALNLFPRQRVRLTGTFGITAYSSLGASSLHPLTIATATLNWGVIDPEGGVDVRLIYDHRVLDGATVARALAELETTLNGVMAAELTSPVAA